MEKNYKNWDWCRYFLRSALISKTRTFFTSIVLLILTITTPLSAQDLQVNISVPNQGTDAFSVCGIEKPIALTIENIIADTLTNVTVSLPLPVGFSYVNSSLSGDASLLNAAIPSFTIDTLFPNIAKNFDFDATANCNSNAGSDNLSATFNYTGGTGNFSVNSANFDIEEATLVIASSIPASLDLALNETTSVTTTLTNTGDGNPSMVNFLVEPPVGLTLTSLTINGTTIAPTSSVGNDVLFTFQGANLALANNGGNNGDPALFESGESFEIIENYQMVDCVNSPDDLVRTADFSCDGAVCQSVDETTAIMINQLTITSQNDTTICPEIILDLMATGGGSYVWREIDAVGTILNANIGTAATYTTGAFTTEKYYRVVVANGNCADSLETVVSRFTPIPVYAGRDQTICTGMTINLSASPAHSNYTWLALPGGPTQSGQTISISPTVTTEYELTANDINGCEVKDTVKVIVLLSTNLAVTITTPQSGVDNFGVCGPEKTVTIEVENLLTDTLYDIVATFDMLPGFYYATGSIGGDATVQDANAPSFLLDTLLPNYITTFTVDLGVNCDGIDEANDPGDKQLDLIFSCLGGGANFKTQSSPTFELAKATLTIPSASPSPVGMYLGKIDTVTSRVVNGSQGDLDSFELFIVNHPQMTLLNVLIDGMPLTIDRVAGGRTYFVIDGALMAKAIDVLDSNNDPTLLEFNEFFDIQEVYEMTACNASPVDLERGVNYGCEGMVCEETSRLSSVQYGAEEPNLVTAPYAGFGDGLNPVCYADEKIVGGFYITNNGDAPATNIDFRIQYYSPQGGGVAAGFDPAAVTIRTGVNGVDTTITPTSVPAVTACTGYPNNLPFILEGLILSPGDTFYIKFDMYNGCGCNQSVGNGCQIRNANSWRILGDNSSYPRYQDLCGFNTYDATRFETTRRRATMTTFLEAPVELANGETGTNTYNIPYYGNSFDNDCPNCYLEATYTIGNGLDITGIMWMDNDGDVWTPDIYTYTDNGISGGGGTSDMLVVRWTGTPPGGFSPGGTGSGILLKYVADCDETGIMCAQGSNATITQEVRWHMPDCNSCDPQYITCPITNTVQIECPTCGPCEGLVHTEMVVQRATLGLGDNVNNNGIPEAGEVIDTSLIRLDRIIRGDTVRAHYEGRIVGTMSYDYAYATLDMAITDYLPLGAELTIYDSDLDTFYTCNIIQQFQDGNNLINNLSVANLNALGCTDLPTDFLYSPGDSISVDFYFTVLQTAAPGVTSHTLNSRFFVSDEAYGGMMYRCNDLATNINQVGLYEYFFEQGVWSAGGCNEFRHDSELRTWLGTSGTASYDYFPNEYRENWKNPKLYTIAKPPELTFVSFQLYVRNKKGTEVFNEVISAGSPYITTNGDDYTFNVEQYMADQGGFPYLDDGARFEIRTRLRGGCATEIGTYNMPFEMEWDLDERFFGTTSSTTNEDVNLTYTGGPSVSIKAETSIIEVNQENSCFLLTVNNVNNNAAGNAFLHFQSPSGGIIINNLREIYADDTFGPYINPATDIYQIGTINGTDFRRFELCVTSNACFVDSLVLFTGWGCDGYPATFAEAECADSDTVKLQPVDAELGMTILQPSGSLVGDLCSTTTYELDLTSGKLGYLNNVHLRFFLPNGVNYTPGTFEISYPVPLVGAPTFTVVGDPVNLYGNVYEINVTEQDSYLDSVGLVGTTDLTANVVRVRFDTETDCDYTSGSKVRFLSYAFDACNNLTNYRFSPADALEINGVTAPFISDLGVSDLEINPCSDTSVPMNISLTVSSGGDPVGPNDSVSVALPIGLTYIPGSYMNVMNSVTGEPTIETVNGEQILYFDLVDGLAPGSTAEFTFNLAPSIQGQQCTDYEMIVQSFSSAMATCVSTMETCNIRVASDEFAIGVDYIVPELAITDFSIASVVTGTSETYTATTTIFNNSGVSVPAGFETTIDIYADVDGNGNFSAADSLLGSIMTTDAIPALTSLTVTDDFTIPANIFCNLIAVVDASSNCTCPTSYSFPFKTITTFDFDKEHTVCSGETILVGPEAIDGYSYEWLSVAGSNLAAIDDVNVAQTDVSFTNVSGANLDWKFALRTIKDSDCYSFDTIDVTIFPQRDAMIATQGCAGFPISLSGPNDGSNYEWTPAIGLANPNSPSTAVAFMGATTYSLTYTDPNGCTAFFEQSISAGNCAGSTTIGDYVWLDENRDGVQDPNEFGIPNVQVFLYNANDLTTPIASTLTGFDGGYLFNPLPAGEYVVGFGSPGTNFTATTVNNSANDAIDSDMDPTTLQTGPYLLANGDSVVTVDAGFVEYICEVSTTSAIERICLGTTLQLGASIGGDVTDYHWEDASDLAANPSPANTTLSDVNILDPIFTPTATGVYTYHFIGSNTNPNLCSDTATLSIIVEGEANPVIISDSILCDGGTMTLFASGGTTYEWFENGLAAGNGTSLVINPTNTSTYRLVATTDFGCTAEVEKTITVLDELTVTAGTDAEICEGETTTIAAQTGFETYDWVEMPSGDAYVGATIMVTPMVTSDYELTVVDSNGCTAIDTVTITVNDLPIPAFIVNNSCGLNPISFTNNSTNAINYTWDFGDGMTSMDNNPMHTYGAVGLYTVQLTATNANGCVDSISQQINVGTITASLSDKQEICPNESVTLVASGGTSYLWKEIDNGGVILNNNLSTSATYQTGNLTADMFYRVIIDNGTCIDSLETAVGIFKVDDIDTDADSPICAGQMARMRAEGGYTNYVWVSQTDGSTYNGEEVIVSPLETTTYDLTAIDKNGCIAVGRTEVRVNPTPEAGFTTSGTCNLNPVVFTNTSTVSSGAMTFDWDFVDGTGTATSPNPTYTYANAGTYTVSLTATSMGCQNTFEQTIEINDISTYITPLTTICTGDNIDLVASGGIEYVWKQLDAVGGNITNPNLSNLSVYNTGNLTTTSFYRVIISNADCTDSLETTVTIPPVGTINAGDNQIICNGEITALIGEFGFSNYQWVANPTGEILVGRIVPIEPNISTTYTLTATDADGCEVTDAVTVIVNSQPTAAFSSTGMCVLNAIDFTNNSTIPSGTIDNYTWDFGDGVGISSAENPNYTYDAEGTYVVKLVIESDAGCKDSVTQNVIIDSISVVISPDQDICANESATLLASGGETYQWKELDGPSGNIINNNLSTLSNYQTGNLTTTTTYRVIITTNNCIDSLETTVNIFPSNTIDAGIDQTICAEEAANLMAESGFTNYMWVSLPDGATYAGQNITVTPTSTVQLALTAAAANGCVVMDTLEITVNPNPAASFTVMGSCGLNPISFTNTSTGGSTYAWDFGDGSGTSTSESPSYTYTSAGMYEVKLVVTSTDNCQDSIIQQINVGSLPITISANQSVCPDEQVTLFASGGTTYLWKILAGPSGAITNDSVGNLPDYTTAALTQTTTFRVIVGDVNCVDSLETTVMVNTPMAIDAGLNQAICEGETAMVSAENGFANYQWQNIATGLTYMGQDIEVSPIVTTDYALQANDANGCLTYDTVQVTVNPMPMAAFASAGVCVLNPIVFTNSSTIANASILTYSWDFGDGSGTSMDKDPTYSYATQGDYAVKLVVESMSGCTDSIIQNITIDSIAPSLTAEQLICPNSAATLVATGGTTYQWKLIDENGNILDENLGNLGVYTTDLLTDTAYYRVVFDNNNCLDSLETQVNISIPETLNAGSDEVICEGETPNLSAPNGFSNYGWINITTGASFIGQSINVSPIETTDYELTADDVNGCSVLDTVRVIVNPKPTPSFEVMGSCGLNPINFSSTSTVSTGSIVDWTYDFGDGNTSDGIPNPSNTYVAAGTYNVMLIVETDFGCFDSITQEIMVGSLPITISADQSICPNETANLIASGGTTYLWKILDGPSGNITNANVANLPDYTTAALTETTTYRVVVSDGSCTDSLETTVTVNTPIAINAGVDQSICEGETATLNALSGFTNYVWVNIGDGNTFTGQNIEVSPLITADYALQANDANGCLTYDTLEITVNPNPVAAFTFTGTCTNNSTIFMNTSSLSIGTIDSYTWNFGDGVGTSNLASPSYPYASEGTYIVSLVIESDNGCLDSISQEITIDNLPMTVFADQGICPNETADLIASGGDTYLWKVLNETGNILDANAGISSNLTTNPLTDTTIYRVIISNNNCTDSLEITVNVFVPATLNAGADQAICLGESANLSAQIGFTNYQWTNLNTGAAFAGKDIVVTPPVTTTYALQAIDMNGCAVADTLEVRLNETLLASIDNVSPILCPVGPNDLVLIALPEMGVYPFTYDWVGPNGFTSTDSIITRTNPIEDMSGIYTLQVTDANGCMSELIETEVIVRSTLDEPILTYSGPACEGTSMTIATQEYAGEQVEFIWSHNNDTIANISHQLIINPVSVADAGQYAVTVIVNECVSFSDTLDVEIYEQLSGNIADVAPQTCVTGSEDLDLVALPANGVAPYTYQWTGPNDFSSTDSVATLVNITSTKSGTYELTIMDANGCSSEIASTTVDITDGIDEPILNTSGIVCEGGQVILSVQEYIGSDITYEWYRYSDRQNNVGNELTIDAISLAEIGEYSVTVIVDGCTADSDTIDVKFFERPIADIAPVTPLTCVTGNEEVQLTALPTDGFSTYTYVWSGPNDYVSTDSIATILNVTSAASGNYTLQVSDANGCVSDIVSTTVDITDGIDEPILTTTGPVCEGEQITLSVQNYVGTSVLYEWKKDGNPITNINNELIINPVSTADIGDYSVMVTVDGCSANSDTIEVEVFEQPMTTIANVAPQTCVTGVEELDLVALPTNGVAPYIYTWSGNGFTATDSIATLTNITAANSGTYTLQIKDANGCTSDIASTEIDITDGIDEPILTTTGPVCEGEQITLSVQDYVGTSVLYECKKDGNPITNINNELIINPVSTDDIGDYSVMVTVDGSPKR